MIKQIFRFIEKWGCIVLQAPIFIIYHIHPQRKFLREEREHWLNVLNFPQNNRLDQHVMLYNLIEFRTLLYRRIGGICKLFRWYLRDDRYSIALNCDEIGKNLVLHHGHGTRIGANKIGENVEIWHNVTIGTDISHSGNRPTIGNNVKIYTGAIVFGNIHIGDNAIIAAGCVVHKNVPANTTIVGNPAKIVKINGQKIYPPQDL